MNTISGLTVFIDHEKKQQQKTTDYCCKETSVVFFYSKVKVFPQKGGKVQCFGTEPGKSYKYNLLFNGYFLCVCDKIML